MRHFKLLLFFAAFALLCGCEKPVNYDPPLPLPDVTYRNIAGGWKLSQWNGEELIEGSYLYIEFDGNARRFEMWDNLGSMYVQHKTGSFTISKDENEQYILSGQYDNGVGDWNSSYSVEFLHNGEDMLWHTGEESMIFSRIDEIPELN